MNIAIILAIIFTLAILLVSIKRLKGFKFEARVIARIGLVAAITIVLYMIKLVPFPQGGGCSLLSMLPIMILAVVFSTEEAIICAIIVASLKIIIQPPYFPLQIPLDYFGSMMAIAFTPMFGVFKKSELVAGAFTASAISIFFSVLSGVIFFGEFAPEGMNVWPYSIMYNVLGSGVEALLCIVVLAMIPLTNLKVLQLKN